MTGIRRALVISYAECFQPRPGCLTVGTLDGQRQIASPRVEMHPLWGAAGQLFNSHPIVPPSRLGQEGRKNHQEH